ncbi:MAG: PEP-CTERM sorting domain-containing protein [Kiritimatiellales bacterium]|nr:PEP-CTERM sorting domain-containing protein [Kiritimatiellales bacterium]
MAELSWDAPAMDLLSNFGIQNGWWVQMYEVTSGVTDLSTVTFDKSLGGQSSDADDILMSGFNAITVDNGRGSISFGTTFAAGWETTYANAYVYTVIFNADSIANASSSIVFNTSGTLTQLGAGDPYTYTVAGTANEWQQVVPEPATAMLLALGGGLAWLVRLKQRLS